MSPSSLLSSLISFGRVTFVAYRSLALVNGPRAQRYAGVNEASDKKPRWAMTLIKNFKFLGGVPPAGAWRRPRHGITRAK